MRITLCIALLFCTSVTFADNGTAAVRWIEGVQGCTFSADEDGLYRYGLWKDDFGVVMAVDADELRKASHRTELTFAVLLTFRYRGNDSMIVDPAKISLEFIKHDHDVRGAVAPDALSATLERDSDRLADQAHREISKHPDRKNEQEAALDEKKKQIQATIEFLKGNSLVPAKLDSGHPEVSGWVFFSTKSKWIGDWKKQEEFVLRLPIAGENIEFPFALPPSAGDFILRRREVK